ncbi:MAG: hypothetical protein GC171_15120 [Terrimonas sp.]|nr:hypothetical protein [Terrimonas sp.]
MIIKINNTGTTGEVEKQFTAGFPYLKIAFFQYPHQPEQGSPTQYRYNENKPLRQIRTKNNCDEIEVTGSMLTKDVERLFEHLFGFHIQVYRKSGKEWVQTIGTDLLSLDEQNHLGEISTVQEAPEKKRTHP